jgi:hypothetical protein
VEVTYGDKKGGQTGVYKHAVTTVSVIRLTIIDVPFTKRGVLSWGDLNAENNKQGKGPQKKKPFTQHPYVFYITQNTC